MKRLVLISAGLAALTFAPAAEARQYELMKSVPGAVRTAARESKIAVRVPATLNLDYDKGIFGQGGGDRRSFFVSLNATRTCGANACFLATVSGEKGGTPAFKRTVALKNGITGYFKPLSCGGSCAPPQIQWVQGGVLYDIQAKVIAGKRDLMRAANSAITGKAL